MIVSWALGCRAGVIAQAARGERRAPKFMLPLSPDAAAPERAALEK